MLDVLTQAQAAKRVGVAPPTIQYWIKKGYLHAEKSGGSVLIKIAELEEVNAKSLRKGDYRKKKSK